MAPSDDSRAHILTRVRRSCAQLLAHEDAAVRVNDDKIRAFLDELDWQQYASLAEPLRFPLNFRSEVDEINFLSALRGCTCAYFIAYWLLLNFGSGYRKDLHKYCDRLYGLIGMYISVPKFNSAYLQNISLDVVANFFNIPLEKDEEISTGIYIAKPQVLNECGEKLVERNYEDFGAFVVANLRSGVYTM
ncbi:hypothetical protein FI667_g7716, partial [Globisporangium splendens]